MTASYSVIISDPFGVRLCEANTFSSLTYTRKVNDWSTATIVLPGTFDTANLLVDGRLEIWRQVPGAPAYLDMETTWLMQTFRQVWGSKGERTIVVEADHPLCLLREPGRFVDSYSGSSGASKTGTADDVIKAIVRECIGTSASGSRTLASLIGVAGDVSQAASVSRSFAWRAVLNVLQDLAADSTQQGTYCAFDIVAPTPDGFEFRTYVGQRGVDHRFPGGLMPVLLDPEAGSIGEASLEVDYRDEVTAAKAGGQGEGIARSTATAQDDARIAVSPFRWREQFMDFTSTGNTTVLTGVARAGVRMGRPRKRFSGRLLSTPDAQYGVHWGWGDFLTVQVDGELLDCRVDAVSVTVAAGGEYEKIDGVLRNDQ